MGRRLPAGFLQHCLGFLVAGLIALGAAQEVRAEAVDMAVQSDEPAAYRERIDEALREFSVQNYEEARSLFLQAHALLPNARTLRALGLCEYELRNYGESVKYLEGALASKIKPLSGDLRADTERMITRARNFVGRVAIELRPPSAQLMVDGVKAAAEDGALWLAMGEHVLEASAPGFVSEKRRLNVKGGEDQTITFILITGDQAGAPAEAGATKNVSEKRWYKSPWLWGTLGVLVVGAGVTTAVLMTRDHESDHNGGSTGTFVPVP